MKFRLDEQTRNDLEIFRSDGKHKCIYDLFNFCRSHGGKEALRKMMDEPSSDFKTLADRRDTIAFFHSNPGLIEEFDIDKNTMDFIDHYLHFNYPVRRPNKIRAMESAARYKLKQDNDYYIVQQGISLSIELIKHMHGYFVAIGSMENLTPFLTETVQTIDSYFKQNEFGTALADRKGRKLKAIEIDKLDYAFRYTHRHQLEYFLNLAYHLDALHSVVHAAKRYALCYPEILPESQHVFEAESLFHPLVKNAVPNSVKIDGATNMLFVTGPNMSGKSTFLKSLGISAYLAHVGFPVPAKSMKISILSGIYSTINLKDNLHRSHSHFYAEVIRIKEIALELNNRRNILVVFDELFRGTNVKDAREGSLSVVSAFAKTNNWFYVISTHIVEITGDLDDSNIRFVYMETLNDEGTPKYAYKIKDGISQERMGLYIIEKEGIINIINNMSNSQVCLGRNR